jgi:hypothetical protein
MKSMLYHCWYVVIIFRFSFYDSDGIIVDDVNKVEYCQEHFHRNDLLSHDTLKIYLVQTTVYRPEIVVLTTSMGLLVLKLSHLPVR